MIWRGSNGPILKAFDGGAEPTLKPADLAAANPSKLRLRLQPYLQFLDLRYPVDDLLLEVRKQDDDTEVASNAFSERHHQKRVSAVAKLKPSPIFLAVHRMDDSVYFRRLQRDEFAILSALRSGKPLKSAVESALKGSSILPDELAANVQHWFQTWALLGWFCRFECKQSSRGVRSKMLRKSSRQR